MPRVLLPLASTLVVAATLPRSEVVVSTAVFTAAWVSTATLAPVWACAWTVPLASP